MKYIKINFFDNDFASIFLSIADEIHDDILSLSNFALDKINNMNDNEINSFLKNLKNVIIDLAYNKYKLNKIFLNLIDKNNKDNYNCENIYKYFNDIELSIINIDVMNWENCENVYIPLDLHSTPVLN